MSPALRKSTYIFLSALLGILLFLLLQRLVVFVYIMLISSGFEFLTFRFTYMELLALDYVTLLLAVLFGGWYGIWLGLYWYGIVYESGEFRGVMRHTWGNFMSRGQSYDLHTRVATVARKLEHDLGELESIAQPPPVKVLPKTKRVVVAKKRVVRRKPAASKTI